MSPGVLQDGRFSFVVHTRELPYEPPHVHVRFGDSEVRICLLDGSFLEEPPSRDRRALVGAFRRHYRALLETWERVHGNRRAS